MAVDALTQPTLEVAQKIGGKRIRVPPRVSLGDLTVNNLGTLKKLNLILFPVAYSDRFYKDVLDQKVTPEAYSKIIFYQDLAVGNVVCRSDPVSVPNGTTLSASLSPQPEPVPSSSSGAPAPAKKDEPHRLYIMTLGVLAPYRRQGLASKLVQHVIAAAEASHRPPVASEYKIKAPTPPEDTPVDKKKKLEKGKPAPKDKEPEPLPARPVIESLYLHVQVGNDEARKFWEKHGFEVVDTVQNYYRKIAPRDAWVLERRIVVEDK